MRKRELDKYRKLLLARRTEVLEDLGQKKGVHGSTVKEASGDLSLYSYHMADQGTDAQEREKSFYSSDCALAIRISMSLSFHSPLRNHCKKSRTAVNETTLSLKNSKAAFISFSVASR